MQLRDGKATLETTNGHAHPGVRPSVTTLSPELNKLPYTNCKTRIINIKHLPYLPTGKDVTDEQYREQYRDYLSDKRHPSPPHADTIGGGFDSNVKKKENLLQESQYLQAAISSLTTGIAPPVAFPTETVYGLGADATNAASIAGIFAAKGRPGDNPLIVHVSSVAHLERCLGGSVEDSAIPPVYKELIAQFWPGPLTILVPIPEEGKGVKFAPNVHPGQKTIGVRLPRSPYARFLIAVADRPIAAPSANSSGKPSPTTAQHVKDDLDGKINFVLDGGDCKVGVESTVVDGLHDPPLILRPGGLSRADIRAWGKKRDNIWQHVENGWEHKKGVKRKRSDIHENGGTEAKTPKRAGLDDSSNIYDSPATQTPKSEHFDDEQEDHDMAAPRAPGMKYKHYAPSGRMFLFESGLDAQQGATQQRLYQKLGELLGMRNTTANPVPGHVGQMLAKWKREGQELEPRPPTHHLNIGILSSTSWPTMADLDKKWMDLYPAWSSVFERGKVLPSLALMELRLDATSDKPRIALNVHGYDLGHDAESIARNLFAALRSCDDAGCDWILAEAPSRRAIRAADDQTIDEFETVLERMRKAASEIIEV